MKEKIADFKQYFELFATLEEAKTFLGTKDQIETTEGMTIERVKKLLGEPKRKAKIGTKIIYKYDDWKITFQDGKVIKVDF